MASSYIERQSLTQNDESTTQLADLPVELIRGVLRFLDVDTIAQTASLICRAWRDAARDADVWRGRLSPRLLTQLKLLEALGAPVSPAHLHLALTGRNFLRNPGFRRDANSVILPPLGSLSAASKWPSWSRWQRTAWVLNTCVGKEVSWEAAPVGMAAHPAGAPLQESVAAVAVAGAPPPPLPYPGGARLVSRMRRAFRGFLELMQRGAALADGMGAALAAPSVATTPPQGEDPPCDETEGAEAACAQPPLQPQQCGAGEGCLATLGSWSEVVQVVDLHWELQRRGLTPAQAAALLDSELGLRLSVHVGARLDSEAEYAVALLLDEGDSGGDDAIPSLQAFVARPSRHLGYREEEHLPPGTWQEFEYVVPALPRGARRAIVMLRGRRAPTAGDSVPATRFCGAKFASAQMVFE